MINYNIVIRYIRITKNLNNKYSKALYNVMFPSTSLPFMIIEALKLNTARK